MPPSIEVHKDWEIIGSCQTCRSRRAKHNGVVLWYDFALVRKWRKKQSSKSRDAMESGYRYRLQKQQASTCNEYAFTHPSYNVVLE